MMFLFARFLLLSSYLAVSCLATKTCHQCIPLDVLLTPAYGIYLSVDGLSSILAFHNGSMLEMDSTSGSPEYRNVMKETFERAITNPHPQMRRARCDSPGYVPSPPSLRDGSFLPFLSTLCKTILNFLTPQNVVPSPEITLQDPISAMLQHEISALAPFASHQGNLSSFRVRVAMPAYLQGTDLGCSLRHASETLFKHAVTFSNQADAAFSALAYDMCRVSSDWMPCDTPPRMMAIEHDETRSVVSASWTDIRWRSNDIGWDVFRADPQGTVDSLRQWIEGLVDEYKPDMITLIGNDIRNSVFTSAMSTSKVSSLLVGTGRGVQAQSAIAIGVAQGAKELMDRQGTDCVEDEECQDILQMADELVGKWKPENVAILHNDGTITQHTEL